MRRWIAIAAVIGLVGGCRQPPAKPPQKVGLDDFPFPNAVTWGPSTVRVNGAPCVALGAGLDGGWIDGGPFLDSGIFLEIDGGVCADGGTSCQACSGTCNIDGGPQYTVPQDGGFAYGGASSPALTSDFIPGGNETVKITCQVLSSAARVSSNVTAQLIGSCDPAPRVDGGTWVAYASTSTTVAVDGGGTTTIGWALGAYSVFPATAIQETVNDSDGGYLCCYGLAQ